MMPTIVAVCAILHNICEIHADEFNEQWLPDVNEAPAQMRMLNEMIVLQHKLTTYELHLQSVLFPTHYTEFSLCFAILLIVDSA